MPYAMDELGWVAWGNSFGSVIQCFETVLLNERENLRKNKPKAEYMIPFRITIFDKRFRKKKAGWSMRVSASMLIYSKDIDMLSQLLRSEYQRNLREAGLEDLLQEWVKECDDISKEKSNGQS